MKSTVLVVYRNGLHIPSSKVEVILESAKRRRKVLWGARTQITVERKGE
jgi:hypothetical protein